MELSRIDTQPDLKETISVQYLDAIDAILIVKLIRYAFWIMIQSNALICHRSLIYHIIGLNGNV